jgi:hypothetical protein
MKRCIVWGVLGFGVNFVPMAQAELLNISSNALQSQNTNTSGCTIVGAGGQSFRGAKILVIMAEGKSADSNPILTVRSLNLSTPVVITNDNWREPVTENGVSSSAIDFTPLLRAPGKMTDAAVIIYATPGIALCAFSQEKSGGDALRSVSISITDVTSRMQGAASHEVEAKYQQETPELAAGLVR